MRPRSKRTSRFPVGARSGRLLIVDRVYRPGRLRLARGGLCARPFGSDLLALCDCGNSVVVTYRQLHGGKRSCGCLGPRPRSGRPPFDMAGKRFGRLVVIDWHLGLGWLCRCDCGVELFVRYSHLLAKRGASKCRH